MSPHQKLAITRRRGYEWDFVTEWSTSDLTDQLAAFNHHVTASPPNPFNGTTIRIPLRTDKQAKESEISNNVVTPQELLTVFEHYQTDVVETMLFLKSIERVEFYLDTQRLGFTQIRNLDQTRDMRAAVMSAIVSGREVSHGMQVEIDQTYSYAARSVHNSSYVYHVRQHVFDLEAQSMSPRLRQWITEDKAVPWISLAARVSETPSSDSKWCGRIFVALPLPIRVDNTLVNVHGMFAVGRDRRSLWSDLDAPDAEVRKQILWNNFLVRDLMPKVWHDLLIDLTLCKSSVYNYFPLMSTMAGSLFNTLIDRVLDRIVQGRNAIWCSMSNEYLPLEEGFITLDAHSLLLKCLTEVGMPIFEGIPMKIIKLLEEHGHPHRVLNPDVVRTWLRNNQHYSIPDIATAMEILEFVSADGQMEELYELPVFLCKDQTMRSLRKKEQHTQGYKDLLYIGTQEESALFDKQGELFLDLDQYPPIIVSRIQDNIQLISASLNLEMFSLQSFDRYARQLIFSHTKLDIRVDTVDMSSCQVDFEWIQSLWRWLDTLKTSEVENIVQSLWLIPLEDSQKLYKARLHISENV